MVLGEVWSAIDERAMKGIELPRKAIENGEEETERSGGRGRVVLYVVR